MQLTIQSLQTVYEMLKNKLINDENHVVSDSSSQSLRKRQKRSQIESEALKIFSLNHDLRLISIQCKSTIHCHMNIRKLQV